MEVRRNFNIEQVQNKVVWIHADPVSGSSEYVGKTGAKWYRKEYEPLGNQEVSIYGLEEDFPTPQQYQGEPVGGAEEPQWQCQAATSMGLTFFEMPTHCQRAIMQNDPFGNWRWEGNPSHISSPLGPKKDKKKPPTLGRNKSSEEDSRRKALTATDKFDNEGRGEEEESENSVGDVSGFFDFKDFGDYLQVNFKSLEASRGALESFLEYGDCKQAIENLLKNLKKLDKTSDFTNEVRSTDILSLFDEITSQEKGGLRINSSKTEAQAEFESVSPRIVIIPGGGGETVVVPKGKILGTGGYANVHVFPTVLSLKSVANNTRKASSKFINQRKIEESYHLMLNLVHELGGHAAGQNSGFSHAEMNAAAKMADSSVSNFDDYVRKHCIPKKYQL